MTANTSLVHRFLILISCILVMLYGGVTLFQQAPPAANDAFKLENGARLEWTNCWFNVPNELHVYCGYLIPSQAKNATIKTASAVQHRLAVVVVRQQAGKVTELTRPILYLSGGPGGNTLLETDNIVYWWQWLSHLQTDSDLVLFDQRGVGMSQPNLKCPEFIETVKTNLSQVLSYETDLKNIQQAVQTCYQRLQTQAINLAELNTERFAQDANELMQLLGGKQWTLYGESYGTKLALAIARQTPERLRGLIAEGVYPLEVQSIEQLPALLDNALSRLFAGCAADKQCQTAYPQLATEFNAALQKLRTTPITLEIKSLYSEQVLNFVLTDSRLLDVFLQSMYQADLLGMLPAMIRAINEGDNSLLNLAASNYLDVMLDPNFSTPVYLSVECQENNSPRTEADIARFTEHLQNTVLIPYTKTALKYDLCHIWQVPNVDKKYKQAVSSETLPALFLSGEYDPITPSTWGKQAASHFKQGYFFEFKGLSHSVISNQQCALLLTQNFLKNPQHPPNLACTQENGAIDWMLE